MLFRYLSRLYDTIHSRGDIEVEDFDAPQPSRSLGRIAGQLRFYDGSLLDFVEEIELRREREVVKIYYKYHYQRADGSRVFRYDNAPHHPELLNFPCHVHIADQVQPADPPDLHDVLRKIDGYVHGSA